MATKTLQVSSYKILEFDTDKGKLYTTVFYLNGDIEKGDYVTIDNWTTGGKFNWFFGKYSTSQVYRHIDMPSSEPGIEYLTPKFNTINGRVKGNLGSNWQGGYIYPFGGGNQFSIYDPVHVEYVDYLSGFGYVDEYVGSGIGSYLSVFKGVPLFPQIFIGTNGTAYMREIGLGTLYNFMHTSSETVDGVDSYALPNANQLGYIQNTNPVTTSSSTFSFSINYKRSSFASWFLEVMGISDSGNHNPAYSGVPISGTGGGDGTFDFTTTDDVDFPALPTLSATSTGFISLWCPTESQILSLAAYMWNADIFTIEFWKKLVADPLTLIYGLNIIPLDLSAISPSIIDSTQNVTIGLIDTKIAVDHLSSQWIELDCGSITLNESWGAYFDYDPFTKLEIYLPYCGVHPLKIDDFMPGTISLKYHIDLLTGSCVAMVKSTKSNKHGDTLDSVVYQFMGNCATQIPVTATQYADAVRSAISIAASIGSMVAVGVGGAAAAGTAKTAGASTHIGMNTLSRELNIGSSAVENVMNLKPAIERSGAIGSSGGMLAVQMPYLILTRPRQANPASQNVYTGYPSFITETLGDLNGWTIVQAIHLDNIPCTSEELDEIDGLLKAGVIF